MDKYTVEAYQCLTDQIAEPGNCVAYKRVTGIWSPIYSQSLLVELQDGLRFVANFRYNLKEKRSQEPFLESNPLLKFHDISTASED
jgi:hypothetical protein